MSRREAPSSPRSARHFSPTGRRGSEAHPTDPTAPVREGDAFAGSVFSAPHATSTPRALSIVNRCREPNISASNASITRQASRSIFSATRRKLRCETSPAGRPGSASGSGGPLCHEHVGTLLGAFGDLAVDSSKERLIGRIVESLLGLACQRIGKAAL